MTHHSDDKAPGGCSLAALVVLVALSLVSLVMHFHP